MKKLLENVTDKRPKNLYGETPLHLAVRSGSVDVTKSLIDAINDTTKINEVNWIVEFSYQKKYFRISYLYVLPSLGASITTKGNL